MKCNMCGKEIIKDQGRYIDHLGVVCAECHTLNKM